MTHKKHQKSSIGVVSEQTITRRGLKICQKGGQIKTLTENSWDVASQSTENVLYRVSFVGDAPTCECPYHTKGEGRRCKHIAAIEHVLLISEELSHDNHITIKKPELRCPDCKSEEYIHDGPYHGKHKRFSCKNGTQPYRPSIQIIESYHRLHDYLDVQPLLICRQQVLAGII